MLILLRQKRFRCRKREVYSNWTQFEYYIVFLWSGCENSRSASPDKCHAYCDVVLKHSLDYILQQKKKTHFFWNFEVSTTKLQGLLWCKSLCLFFIGNFLSFEQYYYIWTALTRLVFGKMGICNGKILDPSIGNHISKQFRVNTAT